MNALLSLLLLFTPVACQSSQDSGRTAVRVHPQTTQSGYSQMVLAGDEGTLILFVRDADDVTAILNGQVVPAEQIVRDGDRLRVTSPEGETLFDVRVATADAIGNRYPTGVFGVTGPAAGAFWGQAADLRFATSRKLIGVTTTPIDAALAAQLDVDPEQVFMINAVNSGMPAEQAGVQPWDVVLEIDGEPPGTVERLRSVLHEKAPGETVRLSILRKGETLDLDVGFKESRNDFAMADGGDMARYTLDALRSPDGLRVRTALDSAYALREQGVAELREALNKARVQLEVSVVDLQDAEAAAAQAGADVDESRLKSLRAAVERAQHDVAAATERFQASQLGAGFLDLGADGGRALYVPPRFGPTAVGGRTDESDKRLALMEERLARLEQMLSEFIESEQGR
jgi:hypothetical protein